MKKFIFFLILTASLVGLFACAEAGVDTESTIVAKNIVDGAYYFDVEYELENFYEPLTATIKVTQRVYESHSVGDTYIFKRPDSENYR